MSSKKEGRAWQRMLSGRRLNLLDPSPTDIEISDIARGLACVNRWNGQTVGEYGFSVADHSIWVADICKDLKPNLTPKQEMYALLHDASEFVIGDMISPFKNALGVDYKQFEEKLEAVIHIRFGLPAMPTKSDKRLIKQADIACAYYEATELAGFSLEDANKFFDRPKKLSNMMIERLKQIEPLSVKQSELAFIERYNAINDQL